MTTISTFISNIQSGTDKYYAFVGSPDVDYQPTNIKDDILLVKRITNDDIIKSVARYDWKYGEVFDQFNNTEYTNGSLNGKKFFVCTFSNGVYKVFKCLNNNKNSLSTISPATINSYSVTTLEDGYTWVYMYKISEEVFKKFACFDFIPLIPDTDNNNNLRPLVVNSIQLTSTGYGYTNATVSIVGDGSGATATAIIENSVITDIILTSTGYGYTNATVSIVGDGSGATATAVVSPVGGHGSNIEAELFCNSVTMSTSVSEKQDYDRLPYGSTYNKYGILKNITLNNNIGDMVVDYVSISNGGSGYSTDIKPTITLTGGFDASQVTAGTAVAATAYVNVGSNIITNAVLNKEGENYRYVPTVSITSPIGSGATATAKLKPVSIRNFTTLHVNNQKSNFRPNETIKQNTTTAKVLFHDTINGVVGLYDIVGSFVGNVVVEGTSSVSVATTNTSNFVRTSNLDFNSGNVFAQYDNITITRKDYQPERINITVLF